MGTEGEIMSQMSVYLEHAEMCLQVAAQLKSDDERAVLHNIAREWQRLAAQPGREIDLATCAPDGHA
jgi:hypothetical protein